MKLLKILKEITIRHSNKICYVGEDETPARIIKGPVEYNQYKNEIDNYLKNTGDFFPINEREECLWYYVEFMYDKTKHWWNEHEIGFPIDENIQPEITIKPFRNNLYEKGNNVVETIVNFIRANPFQMRSTIVDMILLRQWYHISVIENAFKHIFNNGVIKKQVLNPKTNRKVWIYYLSQDKLF